MGPLLTVRMIMSIQINQYLQSVYSKCKFIDMPVAYVQWIVVWWSVHILTVTNLYFYLANVHFPGVYNSILNFLTGRSGSHQCSKVTQLLRDSFYRSFCIELQPQFTQSPMVHLHDFNSNYINVANIKTLKTAYMGKPYARRPSYVNRYRLYR